MNDPSDWMTIGTHGGVGVAAGGLVGFLTRFFATREAQEVTTQLAVIREQLDAVRRTLEAHASLNARVAVLEAQGTTKNGRSKR